MGINPYGNLHYTDHLAVVCVIMGIPLLFTDEVDFENGKKYYPELNAIKIDFSEFNPEHLIAEYDVLFLSDLWDRHVFKEKFSLLSKKYQKVIRHIHCPHGFSDKGFYLKKCAQEDITLVYGQNMLDLLKEYGVFEQLNQYVITGNYRYTFYKKHQQFFDKIAADEVFSRFENPSNPLIIYAPTWKDLEETTSFFEASHAILKELPRDYNIIVKMHPRLEEDDPKSYHAILGRYEGKGNILFLKDYPLVYPLLARASIYLGDMSSVGYDFLTFNRPMFFLNQGKRDSVLDRECYLFRCGVEILPEEYHKLYAVVEKGLKEDAQRFSQIRKQVYEYTFGPERDFGDIKSDIVQAYNTVNSLGDDSTQRRKDPKTQRGKNNFEGSILNKKNRLIDIICV